MKVHSFAKQKPQIFFIKYPFGGLENYDSYLINFSTRTQELLAQMKRARDDVDRRTNSEMQRKRQFNEELAAKLAGEVLIQTMPVRHGSTESFHKHLNFVDRRRCRPIHGNLEILTHPRSKGARHNPSCTDCSGPLTTCRVTIRVCSA